MNFGFSAREKRFFIMDLKSSYEKSENWPLDIIRVSYQVWQEYSIQPLPGKELGANSRGQPCWIDLPPLSEAECLENRMLLKKGMLHEALEELHKLEVIAGITQLSSSDNDKLHSWKSYVKQLYETKIDDSNVAWPDRPEAF